MQLLTMAEEMIMFWTRLFQSVPKLILIRKGREGEVY